MSKKSARKCTRRNSLLRAVIDTNVLFSGLISRDGAPFEILELWRASMFEIAVTDEIVAEYRRVFSRPSFTSRLRASDVIVSSFFGRLIRNAPTVNPATGISFRCRDPKDEMYLTAAIGGGIGYLVTGDDDLLSLAGDARIGALQILRPRDFLGILIAG